MSHITVGTVCVSDLAALREAVVAMGGEWREGQHSYRWYGRWVGDTPLPAGVDKATLGQCDHAIRFPGCEYEVGVRRRANGRGWDLLADYYDSALSKKVGGVGLPRVVQGYTVAKAVRSARRKGFKVKQQALPTGAVKLVVWR